MYCGKCGNKLKDTDKFCNNCGNPVVGQNNVVNNNQPKTNKKNGVALFIIIPLVILLGLIGFVGFIVVLVFGVLNGESNDEYVSLSGDSVPTVYSVVGKRSICNYNNSIRSNVIQITYEYCDGELSNNDYDEYIDYLINEDGFSNISDRTYVSLIKESYDEDMYVIVEIDKFTNTIVYSKQRLEEGNI